ncbi:MAG: MaoC/PaaZ C-terminal domain-containing protein [Bryobacteraceae bacterium]
MSLYFEEFVLDRLLETRGRTITESDVVSFAGLSGDFIELHTNDEYAKTTPFGQRIAHGALIFSVSIGLMTQMNLVTETVLAFYGVDKMRFTKPVFIGDTVRVAKRVIETREMGHSRGLITFDSKVLNQHGETVLAYQDKLLVKRRPSET